MVTMRQITGPFLDSLHLPANGVFVVSSTSPTAPDDGSYAFVAPYVVMIANGQAFLADGVTPWSLPVTNEGQAFVIIQRLLPSGATDATQVRTIDSQRTVSVPAGDGPIAYADLPDVIPILTGGDYVIPPYAQTLLDAAAATGGNVTAAQLAQAAAQQAAIDAGTAVAKLSIVASVANFPGLNPALSNNDAGLAAVAAALVDGCTVTFPDPAVLKYTTAPFNLTDKTVFFKFGATRFRKVLAAGATHSRAGFLNATFNYGLVYQAQDLFAGSRSTYSTDGDFVGTIATTSVTIYNVQNFSDTTAPPWKRGDTVKLVADDEAPGGRDPGTSSVNRVGQMVEVLSVTATSSVTTGGHTYTAWRVVFYGRLRDTFTTNIRAALQSKGTIHTEGGFFDADDVLLNDTGSDGGLLNFIGATKPVVTDISIPSTSAQALQFTSCDGYLVDNASFNFSNNDPMNSTTTDARPRLGYGVFDKNCEHGKIVASKAKDLRHFFTTGDYQIVAGIAAADTNMTNYGRSFGALITGCTAENMAAVAMNTHHGADMITFTDCIIVNCDTAYGARGTRFVVQGGMVRDVRILAAVYQDSSGQSYGFSMTGVRADGVGQVFKSNPRLLPNTGGVSGNRTYTRDTRPNTLQGNYVHNIHGNGTPVLEIISSTLNLWDNDFRLASDFINGEKLGTVTAAGTASTTVTVDSAAAFAIGDKLDIVTLPASTAISNAYVTAVDTTANTITLAAAVTTAAGQLVMRREHSGWLGLDGSAARGDRNHFDSSLATGLGVTSPAMRLIDMGSTSRPDMLTSGGTDSAQASSDVELMGLKVTNLAGQYLQAIRIPSASCSVRLDAQLDYGFAAPDIEDTIVAGSTIKLQSIKDGWSNADYSTSNTGKISGTVVTKQISRNGWDSMNIELTATSSQTLGAFDPPTRRGQTVIITNGSGTAGVTFTLSATDTKLKLQNNANQVLALGESIMLVVSQNDVWRQRFAKS